jgi:hypothetical protein
MLRRGIPAIPRPASTQRADHRTLLRQTPRRRLSTVSSRSTGARGPQVVPAYALLWHTGALLQDLRRTRNDRGRRAAIHSQLGTASWVDVRRLVGDCGDPRAQDLRAERQEGTFG